MVKKNKLKQSKIVNEDVAQIKNLLILLAVVALVCVGIYFLTDKMIEKEKSGLTDTKEVTIDYDIATIGTMFNRVEEEYYVLMYSGEENGGDLDSVLTSYRSSDNYIKTYYIDLDKKINNSVLGDSLVKKPKNSNEVKVKGATLYKIEKGVVTDCITTIEKITDVLK